MNFPRRIRRIQLAALLWGTLTATAAFAEEKAQPTVQVDMKALGATPDLFSDQSDSKYPQRGVIGLFWLGSDRVAAAFSTTRRWSDKEQREPLQIRLIVFAKTGKLLNQRDWKFAAEGPAGDSTLDISSGPDSTILAVHDSVAPPPAGAIPEGNFIQVLKPDTSPLQEFYVPATSVAIAGTLPDSSLILQQFYADKHTSLTWWSGHPLKAGAKLDLPRATTPAVVIVGPGAAARAVCLTETLCSGVRVYRSDKTNWLFSNPTQDLLPMPRVFLSSTALLIELRDSDGKPNRRLVAHQDGSQTPFPDLPKGQRLASVTGVSADSHRLSLDSAGEAGLCGAFALFCKDVAKTYVIDVAADKIVFEAGVSGHGNQSALSPDGKQVAIFDKNKLAIYSVP